MTTLPAVALTPGDPAGIGLDLIANLQLAPQQKVVLFADPALLHQRAKELGKKLSLCEISDLNQIDQFQEQLLIYPIECPVTVTAGRADPAYASYLLKTLDAAIDSCLRKQCRALVTGPVNKALINQAGFTFTGHTEYLAQRCQREKVVMMLATEKMRVALVTTHLPLKNVSAAITPDNLCKTIEILADGLKHYWQIDKAKILVCGLNPHAGEEGHLGDEELLVINPTLETLRQQGYHLTGPVPADTAFNPATLQDFDVVLAMYHDQGLPVLKYSGFHHAVNITLGLPFLRTSVDHGTAYKLAATGQASSSSLHVAIAMACQHSMR